MPVQRPHPELGDDPSVDSLLRAVAALPSPPPSGEERAAWLHETYGERFREAVRGRYELSALLGAGGMGIVYAARNHRTDREVAIKFLVPSAVALPAAGERVARFAREARAAGRIRHPNVVDVYDIETEAELPHLIMERLYGESLRSVLMRGPLPVDETLALLRPAMDGVAEAHRMGVIHRDLKPDNIFIAQLGTGPKVVKVLDFGVSRIFARDEHASTTTLTDAGHMIGTPAYMPLEQLRGDPNVDARIDVYALGVILYEALSGARPYEANHPSDLLIRMATEEPVPLRARAPSVPPALARVVMQALARDPAARPPDVARFAAALDDALVAPPARRRRTFPWLMLVMLVMLAIVAVAVYARPMLAPSHAHAPVQEAPGPDAPARAEAVWAPAPPREAAPLPMQVAPQTTRPEAGTPEVLAPRRRARTKRRDEPTSTVEGPAVSPAGEEAPAPPRVLELRPGDF